MFNEQDFFEGNLDPDNQLKAGPFAQFRYDSGKYRFGVLPNRVDVGAHTREIMPQKLVQEGKKAGEIIQGFRPSIELTAFGMNCDSVFPKRLLHKKGIDFCHQLYTNDVSKIVESNDVTPFGKFQFWHDNLRYEVRIEPELKSSGDNLFVAVNIHQAIEPEKEFVIDELYIKIFNDYLHSFHDRIFAAGGAL